MRIIVAGAGIGGLAAGIALEQAGHEVIVLERVGGIAPVGAGIAMYSNAMEALRRIGVADAVAASGSPIARGEVRLWYGRVLQTQDLSGIVAELGQPPSVALHRAALHDILTRAFRGELRLGVEVRGYRQAGDRVFVQLADGELEGDLLIGADGIHSVVAAQLRGPSEPRYAGYTAWRGLADEAGVPVPEGSGIELYGPGKRFGTILLGGGLVYWFATHNTPPGGAGSAEQEHERISEQFRGWASPVPELLAATPPERVLRHDVIDRPVDRRWGEGRVTLLGDAAHAMTPNMGQGAAQAIEDAVVLGACLEGAADPVAALRRYEDLRRPRATWFVRTSWRIGVVGQWSNPLLVAARDLGAGLPFAKAFVLPGLRRMLRFPYFDGDALR